MKCVDCIVTKTLFLRRPIIIIIIIIIINNDRGTTVGRILQPFFLCFNIYSNLPVSPNWVNSLPPPPPPELVPVISILMLVFIHTPTRAHGIRGAVVKMYLPQIL